MSHPNQNQQQDAAEALKSTMNVNATAWSADSKAFVPSASSMAQPFPAANGGNSFNTQATFTPFGGPQPPMQQNFNFHAQSFQPQPQSLQNPQMMNQMPRDGGQSTHMSNQPMPPPPAAQPQPGNQAPPPMNAAGLNSIYPPSQQNHQWPNQMYNQQPPPATTFTPSNVNSNTFTPSYGRGYNAPQPQPYPAAQGQFVPPGQTGSQTYGGYNNQAMGKPMAFYNQPQGAGPPGQTGHHKKPYNKGGNQHYAGGQPQQYKPKSTQHHQNTGGVKKNSFSGFEAPTDFNPNMNQYKQRNIELQKPPPVVQQPQPASTMPWKPAATFNGSAGNDWSKLAKTLQKTVPSLKKRDILKESLEKHDVKTEADVEHFRKVMQFLKDSKEGKEVNQDDINAIKNKDAKDEDKEEIEEDKDAIDEQKEIDEEMQKNRRKGALHLKLFKKVAELCICSKEREQKENAHCLSMAIMEREVHAELEAKLHGRDGGFKKDHKYKRGDGKGGQHKGNYNNRHESSTPWIKQDSEEKNKLKASAALMKKRLGGNKSQNQKIVLILNIISPDNCVKKMKELRQFLFPDFKTKDQAFEEEIEYNDEEHKLTDQNLDSDTLELVVKNIFRKAQEEKLFCIFYGQVCEELIHLELCLRGMEQSRANLKYSKFRKSLFEVCKDCFEKFFDGDERVKQTADAESAIRFKLKLFGNIEFVGELYRRKILPEATLVSVFESLLGISDTNDTADDLVIEGAVNLMNKVGQTFEQNVKNAGDRKKDNKQQSFKKILGRFEELVANDGEEIINNRVKILIKNMFSNKDSGWLKTQDLNKGPKTKSQVQKEVEDKHFKEAQARNEGPRDRDRRQGGGGYNDYQNDGRRNNDRSGRKGDGFQAAPQGKQRYQAKGGENSYGDGRRDGKNNDRDDGRHGGKRGQNQPVEKVAYEVIEDLEMSGQLKKNFEQFCTDYKTALEMEQEEGEEMDNADKAANKKPNYELYQTLNKVNGKSGDQIVCSLLSSVFDDDTKKVEQHLADYFKLLVSDKILKSKDINQGLSRFGELLPELVLDCPQIHKYLMNCVIRPLQKKSIVQLKYISWKVEEQKKDGDDEDDIIFGTNPFFKLLALILLDIKKNDDNKKSWQDVIKHFDSDLKWCSIIEEKHKNIEDADDLWSEIKRELGDDVAASIIIPLLENNRKKVQEAMKNAK